MCQGQWRVQISFFFNLSSVMAAPWRELAENRRRQVNCICIHRNLEVYQLLWLWNADLAIPEPERTALAFGTGQVLNVSRFRTEAPFPLQEDKKELCGSRVAQPQSPCVFCLDSSSVLCSSYFGAGLPVFVPGLFINNNGVWKPSSAFELSK